MPHQDDIYFAISEAMQQQSAWDAPLSADDLGYRVNVTRKEPSNLQQTIEEYLECTENYLESDEVTSQIEVLEIETDKVTSKLMGALAALCLGVAAAPTGSGPYSHPLTLMPKNVRQGPFTSVLYGYDDGADPGHIMANAVGDAFRLRLRARERVQLNSTLIGKAVADGEDVVIPPCATSAPLKFKTPDCAFTVGGVNRLQTTGGNNTTQELDFDFGNGILRQSDPFPLAAVDPVRLERKVRRDMLLRWRPEGRKGDALYNQAKNGDIVAVSLRVGSATDGLILTIPEAILRLDQPNTGAAGEAQRTLLNILIKPRSVSGAAPFTVTSVNGNSVQYLLT